MMRLDAAADPAPPRCVAAEAAARTAPWRVRPLQAGDVQALACLASHWPATRQLSPRLAGLLHGGLDGLFTALAAPRYLLGGAWLCGHTEEPLGWMGLVRHHERAGYAGTARLIFDLDERVPAGSVGALFRACRAQPGAQGLHVLIGFSDDESAAQSRAYAALGFAAAGTLRLAAHGCACIHAHVLEAPDD